MDKKNRLITSQLHDLCQQCFEADLRHTLNDLQESENSLQRHNDIQIANLIKLRGKSSENKTIQIPSIVVNKSFLSLW